MLQTFSMLLTLITNAIRHSQPNLSRCLLAVGTLLAVVHAFDRGIAEGIRALGNVPTFPLRVAFNRLSSSRISMDGQSEIIEVYEATERERLGVVHVWCTRWDRANDSYWFHGQM